MKNVDLQKNKTMTDNNSSQLEQEIHRIIETARAETMDFAKTQMCRAYNEILCLLKDAGGLQEINQKKVNGISMNTLKDLYKEPGPYTFSRAHLIEFLQAKSLAFESQRLAYPNFMKTWSREEEKWMIRCHNEGMSVEELSQLLHRHPESIVKRLEKLRISVSPL